MELPDFDTLKELATTEPARLDAILEQQIDQLMTRASSDQQRRLRGLQFKIDGQRRLAKNNLDSCIRIANMMRESFYVMRSEMLQFSEQEELPAESDSSGKIICLADYQCGK
jgi:polyhydroxyalkanoate synthesis regulator protein